jgi:hypothetical protein
VIIGVEVKTFCGDVLLTTNIFRSVSLNYGGPKTSSEFEFLNLLNIRRINLSFFFFLPINSILFQQCFI